MRNRWISAQKTTNVLGSPNATCSKRQNPLTLGPDGVVVCVWHVTPMGLTVAGGEVVWGQKVLLGVVITEGRVRSKSGRLQPGLQLVRGGVSAARTVHVRHSGIGRTRGQGTYNKVPYMFLLVFRYQFSSVSSIL